MSTAEINSGVRFMSHGHNKVDITEDNSSDIEIYLNSIFNNIENPLFVKDQSSRLLLVNDACCSMFGLTREEMIGKTLAEQVPINEREHFLSIDRQVLEEGKEILCEEALTASGKQTRIIQTRKTRFTDRQGNYFLVGVINDITERKQAKEELRLAANVFTHALESIMITDNTGTFIEVNETFTRMSGYSRDEVMGKTPRILKSGRQSSSFYKEMWHKLLTKGYWRGELWNRRKNGEIYAEMLTINAVKDSDGNVQQYVALSTDITQLKQYQRKLERIAHYDVLTNVPNRVLLSDLLSKAIMQCQRRNKILAVAFLDIDGFKSINDSHGHNIGDELLIAFSKRIKDALREGDTLARIGGDEFIVVMSDLEKPDNSKLVLERLLKTTINPFVLTEAEVRVSTSIGVAFYPQDGLDADQLIRHSDRAMYDAKRAGKNCYHLFDIAQDNAVKLQLENINDIRLAIEKRELLLHYQPKVNMQTGEVIGVEALIRWQHPVRGLIPSLEFLPVTEGHEIGLEIGEWVLNNALEQIKHWQKMGITVPVSVNISAYQLQQADFVTRLQTLLTAHPQVKSNCLELEVLETSELSNISRVSDTMTACHKLGLRFALDDFGTGYSSLNHLRRLPTQVIKIDQSFVRDMLEDADDLAIVEGVIGLASAFKRDVIAEGVETIAHGAALLKLGCKLAQGFGIARPMPAIDIPKWIDNWKPHNSWQNKDN